MISVNPNHGDYLGVVKHPHDGCQWNPTERRGALVTDAHFLGTTAAVLVGSQDSTTGITYRLCADCANRSTWKRGHLQRPIRKAKHA